MKLIRYTIIVMFLAFIGLLSVVFMNDQAKSAIAFQKIRLTFMFNEFMYSLSEPALPENREERNLNNVAYTIPVILYHGLIEDGSDYSISKETFRLQLEALYKAGYQTVTLEQLNGFLKEQSTVPEKSFIITFDDGRKDSFYEADQILKTYGFSAVMFMPGSIITDSAPASSYYLDRNDLKLMESTNRWEIGSHGMQIEGGFVDVDTKGNEEQFLSNKKWLKTENRLETNEEYAARVNYELHESKSLIEEKLAVKVIALSYPFGDYGQDSQNATDTAKDVIAKAVKDNYEIAFQQVRPLNGLHVGAHQIDNPLFLSRIEPKNEFNDWDAEKLITHLQGGEIKPLPFSNLDMIRDDWKTSWGAFHFEGTSLIQEATPKTEGAFSFLEGSFTWKDYFYTAEVNWEEGSHFLLVARVLDSDNYVQCSFNKDYLRIEQLSEGLLVVNAVKKNFYNLPKSDMTVSMAVRGNKVDCYIGKNLVISATANSSLPKNGAIGVKIWDQRLGVSKMKLINYSVTPY